MKGVSYILLAVVLVLAIVFFVRGKNSDNLADSEQMEETNLGSENSRMTGEALVFPDGSYQVDITSSHLGWKGEKKIVETSHEGTLAIKSGTFSVVNGLVSAGKFVIDMESLSLVEGDAGGDKLLEHLQSADFFSISEYPEAVFSITEVTGTPEKQKISGMLTIKDKTNLVTFDVSPTFGPADQSALGGQIVIDRSQFDVRFGSETFFDDLGDAVIKNEIVIDFVLVGSAGVPDLE